MIASSHPLDASAVAALVEAQFPDLAPARAAYLGDGCDSTVFEVNARWVFRFPKREEVARQMEVEAAILPALQEAGPLPLAVPRFSHRGVRSGAYPLPFVGYPVLPGLPAISLDPRELSPAALLPLGRFLARLHAFPVERALALGVGAEPVDRLAVEVAGEALDDLPIVAAIAPEWAGKWRAFLEAGVETNTGARPVLAHGDLAGEHVLHDPATRSLTGIIDWTDIVVSDPAVDFAGVLHWGGERLLGLVLSAYDAPVPEASLRLARYLAACRGVADVVYGVQRDRPDYVAAGLRALSRCAGE